ncbi:MAG: helix-turn-helix transcriptional regulator [Deltaproteobacteria bacterium]|nr:helix-turn-helix transcriptional regulator [Deltaproteobacteria bacterium]
MYNIKCNFLAPFLQYRKKLKLSEHVLSKNAHLSRSTLRHIESHQANVGIDSLGCLSEALHLDFYILASPPICESDFSTIGASFQIIHDGFLSWKIYFFNLVDEFRRTLDAKLLLLPPSRRLEFKLQALLASIVLTLSDEAKIDAPPWAKKRYFLREPWFVSETESLKATSILESPLYFRSNNIFVLGNFLERA